MGDFRFLFATDLHGSESAFRKFVNAGRQLKVDALLMGGDLAGKAIIPVVRDGETYTASFGGRSHAAETTAELDELVNTIRVAGCYVHLCDAAALAELRSNPTAVEELFRSEMHATLRGWCDLAQERLEPLGIRFIATAGNDDPWDMDDVLAMHPYVELCDDRVVQIDGAEVIGFSATNPTPWHSPREFAEDEIKSRLEAILNQTSDPLRAVLNVHVPPYRTGIDDAPEVDDELRIVTQSGAPKMIPVGSTAVRTIIEEYQPAVGVHGHVHESAGINHLGKTLILNPGSEYSEGLLAAALVRLTKKGPRAQLISG